MMPSAPSSSCLQMKTTLFWKRPSGIDGAATRKRPTRVAAGVLDPGMIQVSPKSMGIVRTKIKAAKGLYFEADRQKPRFCSRVRPSNCHERGRTMAKVGDKVPSATLRMMSPEGPKPMTTEELFAPGKKVVAFALPGAFTPTCSAKHVPGFVSEF